jgi:sporadic carbohydrate cluster protein (TIGR04323 family)
MTQHVREKLVGADDVDAALEESLTTTWDAKVYSWDNSKYEFDYELFDLEDMTHLPTLRYLIEKRVCNIVMYSIFALPEEESYRNELLATAVQRGSVIHFVNEDLQLTNADDLKTIKKYLEFSKYSKSRLPIGLPLRRRASCSSTSGRGRSLNTDSGPTKRVAS